MSSSKFNVPDFGRGTTNIYDQSTLESSSL